MSYGFSNGHDAVAIIDLAAKQNAVDFGREARRFAELFKAVERFFMMLDEFIKAAVRAAKRNAVSGANKDVFRQRLLEFVAAINPFL